MTTALPQFKTGLRCLAGAELARLQAGMRVLFQGVPHRVVMVNESRALIECEQRTQRTIHPATGANAGKDRLITESARRHSVSPNAELEILSREGAKEAKG